MHMRMPVNAMRTRISLSLLLSCCCFALHAQIALVQLSGFVSDAQTHAPIPFANVAVVQTYRGTSASSEGFFSLPVHRGDTLMFSATGYKSGIFVVPDSIAGEMISAGIFLSQDTIFLGGVEIHPWPTPDDFRRAFLAYEVHHEYEISKIPGIKTRSETDTIEKAPTIFNPISLIYQDVIQPIEWNRRKKDKVSELPEWK